MGQAVCGLESGIAGRVGRIKVREARIVDITAVHFREGGTVVVEEAMCVSAIEVITTSIITSRLGPQWNTVVSALQRRESKLDHFIEFLRRGEIHTELQTSFRVAVMFRSGFDDRD